MLLSDSGYLTYIITTKRIASDYGLKQRTGLGGAYRDFRLIREATIPAHAVSHSSDSVFGCTPYCAVLRLPQP